MNVSLPYNWIKEYVKTNLSAEEFAKKVSLSGSSIERWNYNKKLDDYLLDVEITPNRPDTASIIGTAREASAILNADFLYKEVEINEENKKEMSLKLKVKDKNLCPRYQAIVLDNIKIKESPDWLKKRIEASGMNSINNVVDATNYVLLEYGQPTHVFDYNKIEGKTIVIRKAKNKEKITALGGDEYELKSNNLVIADAKNPIAIAGVKGGVKAEVTEKTKTIIIESANFEPYSIRKTARSLDLRTDASALFEKGLNIYSTNPALLRVAQLIQELAKGEVSSIVFDTLEKEAVLNKIKFNTKLIERKLGVIIPDNDIVEILEKLEFVCEKKSDYILVTVPYFRTEDVKEDYDLVEEVARIYGYHKIPSELPSGEIPIVKPLENLVWEDKIKDILVGVGFTETFSYSMISDKQLKIAGVKPSDTIEILNPLTDDFKYMKTEMASTMIEIASKNETLAPKLKLFELNKVYIPTGEKSLPIEQSNLAVLVNGDKKEDVFYELKGVWEYLLAKTKINKDDIRYKKDNIKDPYQVGSSTIIFYREEKIATLGVISDKVKELSGIKKETAVLEINFEALYKIIEKVVVSYSDIPKYPAVIRDFAFVVEKNQEWEQIEDRVKKIAGDLFEECELFDVYKGKGMDENKKSIAFHLVLQSKKKTLLDKDINLITDKIIAKISKEFNAQLRK